MIRVLVISAKKKYELMNINPQAMNALKSGSLPKRMQQFPVDMSLLDGNFIQLETPSHQHCFRVLNSLINAVPK